MCLETMVATTDYIAVDVKYAENILSFKLHPAMKTNPPSPAGYKYETENVSCENQVGL